MRIDKITSIYENYNAKPVSKVKGSTKVEKKDEVALSGVAKDFQTVCKALADVPDVRQDKVDALKERIQSGNYNVEAKEVANKILASFDLKG